MKIFKGDYSQLMPYPMVKRAVKYRYSGFMMTIERMTYMHHGHTWY